MYHITNEVTYETLWQISQKEKQTNELQLLPKTFYGDVRLLIASFEKRELSEEELNIRKNVVRLINEIYERRKQKLLIYAAYRKPLPQPAVPVEQDFYAKITEMAEKNKFDFTSLKNTKTLQSLKQMPEIILPSGRRLGPLEKDQVVEIGEDEEDIKFLINNTICKQL